MDNKVTAEAYSASVKSEKGISPLQWGDKCFLCSCKIGEAEPRDFYIGSGGAMMLCHLSCLHKMQIAGGRPEDYHRALKEGVYKDAPTPRPEAEYKGPGWLRFSTLTDFQTYVESRGRIPDSVKVSIGDQVVQGGR